MEKDYHERIELTDSEKIKLAERNWTRLVQENNSAISAMQESLLQDVSEELENKGPEDIPLIISDKIKEFLPLAKRAKDEENYEAEAFLRMSIEATVNHFVQSGNDLGTLEEKYDIRVRNQLPKMGIAVLRVGIVPQRKK